MRQRQSRGIVRASALALLVVFAVGCETSTEPEATTVPGPADPAASVTSEPTDSTVTTPPGSGDPIRIGYLNSISGPFAPFGRDVQRGIELAIEYFTDGTNQVSGRPIEILVRDDESNPEVGLTAARELLESEQVDVLMGTTSSGVVNGVIDLAEANETLYFPTNTGTETRAEWFNPYTFHLTVEHNMLANALMKYAATQSDTGEWVHLDPDYVFSYSFDEAIQEALEEHAPGHTLVETIYAPLETTDFTQYLLQVQESGATHMVVNWPGNTLPALYQQMSEMGLVDDLEFIGGSLSVVAHGAIAGYTTAAGSFVATSPYHSYLDNDVNEWFVAEYSALYEDHPDAAGAFGFGTAHAYLAALEAAGGATEDPQAIIEQLEGMELETIYGTLEIRPGDHQGLTPVEALLIENTDDPNADYFEVVGQFAAEEVAPPCEVADRC